MFQLLRVDWTRHREVRIRTKAQPTLLLLLSLVQVGLGTGGAPVAFPIPLVESLFGGTTAQHTTSTR